MDLGILFNLAILLFCGLAFAKIIRMLKLPDVTGYLIGGLLIGPSVIGLLNHGAVEQLSLISDVALGFIAFSIGSEFKISYFKRVGVMPIVIAICESFLAVFFVVMGLLATGQSLPFSLVLGAIAAATAPAATIMVIKQYRAKGAVTETLLSVVAIDDATALVAFGICVSVAQTLTSGENASLLSSLLAPILEIVLALLCGGALGVLFTFLLRVFKSTNNRLVLSIAFVLIASAIAKQFNLSALLLTMAMGAVIANLCKNAKEIMSQCDSITPPIFMMFFVLSGTELDLSILPSIGVVGVVYVVLRVVGKITGAWMGASIMKAEPKIRKWLGPALLPQAGVAIGLTVVAQTVVPQYAPVIRAVVLCATLIYELIGPAVSKWTLKKAGEIAPDA